MKKAIFFTLIQLLLICDVYSQKYNTNDSLTVSISCFSSIPEKPFITFWVSIINWSHSKVVIPSRFISGEVNNGVTNLGYELLFCGEDTLNITDKISNPIKIGSPVKISRELLPLSLIETEIIFPKFLLKNRGKYLFRVILKKISFYNNEIKEISGDVYSDWFYFLF